MTLDGLAVSFALFSAAVWLCRRIWTWARSRWPRIDLKDAMSGSVYIFWDRSFLDPNRTIIKIGVSRRRNIEKRLEEVRKCMGGDPVCIWKMDHVPFPFAVEFAAHQYMSRWRVRWRKGSRRGREWFWVTGDEGMARAMAAVERACRRVRRTAIARKRWSATADTSISIWRLSGGRVFRSYPFRQACRRSVEPQKISPKTARPASRG